MRLFFVRIYKRLERAWQPHVKEPGRPLVRVIDAFMTPCIYCTAWRAIVLGFGLGIVAFVPIVGALAIGCVVVLVAIERLACGIGPHPPDSDEP